MKVLLCSYFKFPNGCAGAVRHEKLAQMLQSQGHDVLVVGLGTHNHFQIQTFKGIKFTSLRLASSSFWGKFIMRFCFWKNFKKKLNDYSPDCVIMDDLRPRVTMHLKRYTLKRNILLIHDSVEWYSRQQFKLNWLSPAFINKNIVNRYLIDDHCRVIAISQYLKNHFESKNVKCVNIPIVISGEDLVKEKTLGNTINITYAGQAGKKDYLNVIIAAMTQLSDEERGKIRLNILGCTEQQMIQNGIPKDSIQLIGSSIAIYGRIPRNKVFEVLKKSDFTILIRSDELRYAKAGFPTKVVESLSHSTPVIANLTSDLGSYLVDGYNSLVVSKCSADALAIVLKKVVTMPMETRKEMCKKAYDTALERFHYNNFLANLNDILN